MSPQVEGAGGLERCSRRIAAWAIYHYIWVIVVTNAYFALSVLVLEGGAIPERSSWLWHRAPLALLGLHRWRPRAIERRAWFIAVTLRTFGLIGDRTNHIVPHF